MLMKLTRAERETMNKLFKSAFEVYIDNVDPVDDDSCFEINFSNSDEELPDEDFK